MLRKYLKKQNMAAKMKISEWKPATLIWFLPALAPFLLILFSFIFDVWSWGLMDDHGILECGTGSLSRWRQYFPGLIQWGVFRPVFVLHSAVFYSLFSSSAKAFYIFKLFEVFFLLVIWGIAGYRITRRKIALWFIPAITLSFHYFYDTFFYLSSHEFLGLWGVGLAVHCFISALRQMACPEPKLKKAHTFFMGGILCLLFAFASKETFVSCGMAAGFSLFLVSFFNPDKRLKKYLLFYGFGIMALSAIYAIGLKIFIQSSYTSHYQLGNWAYLGDSLLNWFKKDFLNHIPWLIFLAWAWKNKMKPISTDDGGYNRGLFVWGMLVSIFLYLGFLAVLLPWNTLSYYASPLGLFFASAIGIGLIRIVDDWNTSRQLIVVILALTLNLLVCYYALSRERTYQADTYNLMQWLKARHEQLVTVEKNTLVSTNAMEAGNAIPAYLKRQGVVIPVFSYGRVPSQEGNDIFYLYSPRFGFISSGHFKNYQMEFFSRNWVLYKKRN